MSAQNLHHLFAPKSVAVIGASSRHRSIGSLVMRHLLAGGFEGPIMPVNPKYQSVAGVLAYKSVSHLPTPPDLAIFCIPPLGIPEVLQQLGDTGTSAAIILTAGLDAVLSESGATVKDRMLEVAP